MRFSNYLFTIIFLFISAITHAKDVYSVPASHCPNLKFWRFPVIQKTQCTNSWCDVVARNDIDSNIWVIQVRFPAQSPFTKNYGLTGRPFFYNWQIDMPHFTWQPLVEKSGIYISESLANAVAHLPEDLSVSVSECHYTTEVKGYYVPVVAKIVDNLSS